VNKTVKLHDRNVMHIYAGVLPLKCAIPIFHRIQNYFIHYLNGLVKMRNEKNISNSSGMTEYLATA
jgi:hypothetical protein